MIISRSDTTIERCRRQWPASEAAALQGKLPRDYGATFRRKWQRIAAEFTLACDLGNDASAVRYLNEAANLIAEYQPRAMNPPQTAPSKPSLARQSTYLTKYRETEKKNRGNAA